MDLLGEYMRLGHVGDFTQYLAIQVLDSNKSSCVAFVHPLEISSSSTAMSDISKNWIVLVGDELAKVGL